MKSNKEAIIGLIVTLSVIAFITALTGIYGIIYLGLGFTAAFISLNLFSRKSIVAKTSAVVVNTDIIYKILMPKKYKNKIKELEVNENTKKT